MPFIINAQRLTKIYREKESGIQTLALDDVSLTIQEKDFVAIAGPSGSGKTTLLNILGGLDKPTQGDLVVDETDLTRLGDAALAEFRLKKIGFVFQAYNLIPTLTVLENVEYVALLQGIPEKRRRHEATHILKDLGLENFMHRRPNQLSAGQQQRAAVVRAILAQPKLILADEPTANLDSKTGDELIRLMHDINQNLGITFIFATHDKSVMEKAKTLIQMRDGKIIG
jgi:putative ABC transport system ATP-binding protein